MNKDVYIYTNESFGDIIEDFPENYEEIITSKLELLEKDFDKIDYLIHLNAMLLNSVLNGDLPRPEKNYILIIKEKCFQLVNEIRENDNPSIGRLTLEQRKKYYEVDEDKVVKIPQRLVREGTVGDCSECGSTTIKRFFWFGMTIGCIQKECKNYYKKHKL